MNKPMNLQDAFLNSARKAKVPVTIHVTNGYQIKNAIITGYDSFVVTAEAGNEQMMLLIVENADTSKGNSDFFPVTADMLP